MHLFKSNRNSADKNKEMDALGAPPVPISNTEAKSAFVMKIALFLKFACEGWIGVQQATDKMVIRSSKRLDSRYKQK